MINLNALLRRPVEYCEYPWALEKRVAQRAEAFLTFAEKETAYFINFYRKWIAARRYNTLAIAYKDLIDAQEQTLTADRLYSRRCGHRRRALAATLARVPAGGNGGPGGLCDPRQHRYYDADLYARLERQVADACGRSRVRFHFI